jgi:D-ribose pyranose/furanose isomerase RbsD
MWSWLQRRVDANTERRGRLDHSRELAHHVLNDVQVEVLRLNKEIKQKSREDQQYLQEVGTKLDDIAMKIAKAVGR